MTEHAIGYTCDDCDDWDDKYCRQRMSDHYGHSVASFHPACEHISLAPCHCVKCGVALDRTRNVIDRRSGMCNDCRMAAGREWLSGLHTTKGGT